MLTRENRLKRNHLLPLAEAVALAYERLYAINPTASTSKTLGQDLNAIADVLSTMVDLYTFNPTGGDIRKLAANEVNGGSFKNGARELTFPEGLPTLTRLAVLKADFDRAIEHMKARKTQHR